MSFRIRSNIPALRSLNEFRKVQDELARTNLRLSSGKRVNTAADDPAAFAISKRFETYIKGFDQASINADVGYNLVETGSGAINEIVDLLQDIRVKAVQASSGAITDTDRAAIQTDVNSLLTEIDRIASSTFFNGKQLLGGAYASGKTNINIQVGVFKGDYITVNFNTVTTASLSVNGLDVSTQGAANTAITTIDNAINKSTSEASNVGAIQNRLEAAQNVIDSTNLAYNAAVSSMVDADLLAETVKQSTLSILSQSGAAALSQANLIPQRVLDIILNIS